MPHSSGGGSHGGGSRGGGSRAHSSGGGSYAGVSQRTSTTRFSGSSRYIYYHKGRPQVVYSNTDLSRLPSRWWILAYLPFFAFCLAIPFMAVKKPKPLETNYNTASVIKDAAHLLDLDEIDDLYMTFNEFRYKTGITPAFVTVNHELWQEHYSSLEKYAYDLYVNNFEDERHWLIVYSEPENVAEGEFNDWSWEGMQGNDTDDILTPAMTKTFNETLYKYLLARSRYTVGQAANMALEEIIPMLMQTQFFWPVLIFSVVIIGFTFMHMVLMLDLFSKYRGAKPCDEIVVGRNCEYCGSLYYPGTISKCPNCGAPLPAVR